MLQCSNVFDRNYQAYKNKNLRYIINQGGTSSTKTFSTLQLLTAICLKYPKQIDIVGLSVPHLKSGVLNDMPKICEQFGINFSDHYKESDRQFKAGKGTINFLAFDKLGKAHGGRRDILYMNEANHLNYNIVEQLMVRTRDKIFIDYNPTGAFWVHTKILKEQPEKTELIKSTYKDNPFLEQEIINMIESKKGNNNFWRVYGLGELGIAEGLIFDNFEELEFDKNMFDTYYNGIDWGFSQDPFAFVRCARHNNCLYITDEIYQRGLLNPLSAPMVKEIIGNEYVYCDCAEPKSIAEYQSLGVNALPCQKGAGSVETGIKHLQYYDKIYIHPSCPNTLDNFRNYQWKTDKNGECLPIPIDAFNHCLIAGTKILTSKGYKNIENITSNDFVLTRKGFKKVLASGISDFNRDVYEVCTSNNKSIIGTDNHKILTTKGFRCINELRYGDILLTIGDIKGLEENKSNMMEKYGIDILMQKGQVIETILKKLISFYITMFGKNFMAKEKRDMLFIIKTVILEIITLKTLKKLHQKNIKQKDINLQKNNYNQEKNGAKRLDRLPKSGMLLKRVLNGIKNMLKFMVLDMLPMALKNAKFVEKNLQQKQNHKDFVPIIANQNTEGIWDLITKQEYANIVEKSLLQTNIQKLVFVPARVSTIRKVGKEKLVYDLTIEDTPEFFANDILVHNCPDAIRYALNDVVGQNFITAIKGLKL